MPRPERPQAPPRAPELGCGAAPPYLAWLRPVGSGGWACATAHGRDAEPVELGQAGGGPVVEAAPASGPKLPASLGALPPDYAPSPMLAPLRLGNPAFVLVPEPAELGTPPGDQAHRGPFLTGRQSTRLWELGGPGSHASSAVPRQITASETPRTAVKMSSQLHAASFPLSLVGSDSCQIREQEVEGCGAPPGGPSPCPVSLKQSGHGHRGGRTRRAVFWRGLQADSTSRRCRRLLPKEWS